MLDKLPCNERPIATAIEPNIVINDAILMPITPAAVITTRALNAMDIKLFKKVWTPGSSLVKTLPFTISLTNTFVSLKPTTKTIIPKINFPAISTAY